MSVVPIEFRTLMMDDYLENSSLKLQNLSGSEVLLIFYLFIEDQYFYYQKLISKKVLFDGMRMHITEENRDIEFPENY